MARKQLPVDFKEFIDFLNKNEVEYLLVGGWAVGFYGNPRATKDIDFLVAIDNENLAKLQKTLNEFGTPSIDMAHFKKIGNVFRLGRSPVQINIINEANGIDIKECYARRKIITIEGILNKKQTGIRTPSRSCRCREFRR
jgi:hypothetical protein